MSTFLIRGHYLGFASGLQLQIERQAKLLVAIPLQEFALDFRLFMLMPKQISKLVAHRHQQKRSFKALPTDPLQQFIHLVSEPNRGKDLERKMPSPTIRKSLSTLFSDPAKTVHLRSPTLLLRRSSSASPEILTLAIGTQNKTIQTVTAGIIIQQLGLLEHYLPREGRYRQTEYQIQWHDFTSGAPIVAGLQSQQLDIGILEDYPLLLSGVPATDSLNILEKTRLISFVASNPDGTGNSIIVPERSPLKNLGDLYGRVIAVPFASSAHGMMMRTLSRANLLQDVTLSSIENLNLRRLTPHKLQTDGYTYFSPLHEIASHRGRFRRLPDDNLNKLPTFMVFLCERDLPRSIPTLRSLISKPSLPLNIGMLLPRDLFLS
ncbi:MAG: hypothetical protein AB4290_30115 [Spirulina sp.]